VVITSPYVNTTDPERLSISFSAGGNLTCNPGGVLSTVNLGGNGNASANTVRAAVPEPGSLGMLLGTGVFSSLFLLRRKRTA